MTRAAYLAGLLTLLLVALLPGCLSPRSHRGTDPYVIRHHTWWNYYQRGRLYLREGKSEEARKDFETALGRIPGARYPYTQERWRVRTYGMHMMEGYFPHRELGICMLKLNEPQEALNLLETSMRMEPSARAKFYINRIRERQAMAAAPPPQIHTVPLPGWTDRRSVWVQGAASGSNPVSGISMNSEPEFIELAMPRLEFRKEFPLQEGNNQISITAADISGKQTTTNLLVTADWTPPQIHLRRAGTSLTIICRDNLELHELQVNNRTVAPTGQEHAFDWPLAPGKPLRLAVSDRAGNRVEWALTERELHHLSQSKEAAPPSLHVSDAGKTITLYNPEYALDIRAEDDTALRTVKLNGENLLTRTSPLFRTLRRIPLATGGNRLVLTAEDHDGNRTEEQINIIYHPPEYMDRIYRLAATLSPLAGEIPNSAFERRVNHLIGHELTLDPVRFYLLATEDEARRLRKEKTLSGSTMADPRAILKQGKKLDADMVFIVRVLSDGAGQTVYLQVLDTDTGNELFIEDIYLEDPRLLPQQLGGLVMKVEQRFPLIQANVQTLDNRLSIDAGEKNGMRKGMRFLVIRSDSSIRQGRVIHTGNHPAELVVSEIESENAMVIIPRGQTKDSIQPGDYAYSR
ncbi:MAG: FlgT C-terminal domain-containing protein [Verrucomicrobiota bacterium]